MTSSQTDLIAELNARQSVIGIVGLGYVSLPLAVAFGKVHPVVGFDINVKRITQLQQGHDATLVADHNGTRIVFSGDLGASHTPLLPAPERADTLVL